MSMNLCVNCLGYDGERHTCVVRSCSGCRTDANYSTNNIEEALHNVIETHHAGLITCEECEKLIRELMVMDRVNVMKMLSGRAAAYEFAVRLDV